MRRPRFSKVLILSSWLTMTGLPLVATHPAVAEEPRAAIKLDLHVDDDNAGQQDGSAAHPFKTVQQAIDAAANNQVIAVAGGTYAQNIVVRDKAVQLYGGYTSNFAKRDSAVNQTQLRGNGKDSVVTLYEAGASVVDGFQVTGGGGSSLGKPHSMGGGFYIWGGSPICVITRRVSMLFTSFLKGPVSHATARLSTRRRPLRSSLVSHPQILPRSVNAAVGIPRKQR